MMRELQYSVKLQLFDLLIIYELLVIDYYVAVAALLLIIFSWQGNKTKFDSGHIL